MKNKLFLIFTILLMTTLSFAQNGNLPYHQIPDYPKKFNSNTVAARMIDGLGYRYYWATEELTDKDLDYKAGNENRSIRELTTHMYLLSLTILNGSRSAPNMRPLDVSHLSYEEMRAGVLNNLKEASDILKANKPKGMKKLKVIFQRGEKKNEFPYWNLINGPIADAIYHTGQIVAFRRAAGNPINPKVNVFIGKTRE